MNPCVRKIIAGAFAFGVLVASASPAFADEVTVRNIDTTAYPHVKVSVLVNGASPTANDFAIRENGKVVSKLVVRPLSQTTQPVGTVLAIDCSGSMKSKGAIDAAKAAARTFVQSKAANDSVAIICFSDAPQVLTELTSDSASLLSAIDRAQAVGETALWDALVKASSMFTAHPEMQANIVLLSDGGDTASQSHSEQAIASIASVHAAVFAIGLQSNEFKPEQLQSLVNGTGGSLLSASNPGALAAQFAAVRTAIANQYEVSYESPGQGGALTIELTAGALHATADTRAGTKVARPSPHVVKLSNPGIFGGAQGKIIVLVLVTAAVALFAYGLLLIFVRDTGSLTNRLRAYKVKDASPEDEGPSSLLQSGLLSRAVDVTGKLATDSGLLAKTEDMLEQANIALRPAEALFMYGAGVVVLGLLALFTAPSPIIALFVIVILLAGPPAALNYLKSSRLKKFESQLPDMLQLLGGSLRAGYSLLQGLEAVSQETPDPIGRELRRILAEARLGRSLEDALHDTAQRMKSRDFEWAVMAINIQREVGGNLAELLQTVAETMTSRERIRREIKALTAEGRISALVMGILPIGLGGFLFAVSPDYIGTLFHTGMGLAAIGGSAVLAGAGIAWLFKIIKIEV